MLNERCDPNFALKLVAVATSFEEPETKEVQIDHSSTNKYLPYDEKIVKISPVDPEIIWLQIIFKKHNYSPFGQVCRAG